MHLKGLLSLLIRHKHSWKEVIRASKAMNHPETPWCFAQKNIIQLNSKKPKKCLYCCVQRTRTKVFQAAPEKKQEAFFLLTNTFRIDVGMTKVNPCGYISKIVFSSQKPISSSKSKTFFFSILWDRFNPSTEEKVSFSRFFFATDFNNVPCFTSSCRRDAPCRWEGAGMLFMMGKCVHHIK